MNLNIIKKINLEYFPKKSKIDIIISNLNILFVLSFKFCLRVSEYKYFVFFFVFDFSSECILLLFDLFLMMSIGTIEKRSDIE